MQNNNHRIWNYKLKQTKTILLVFDIFQTGKTKVTLPVNTIKTFVSYQTWTEEI